MKLAARTGDAAPAKPAAAPAWRADDRLQRLEWTVLKRLDGILQGDWRTLFRGHGLDLAELREAIREAAKVSTLALPTVPDETELFGELNDVFAQIGFDRLNANFFQRMI